MVIAFLMGFASVEMGTLVSTVQLVIGKKISLPFHDSLTFSKDDVVFNWRFPFFIDFVICHAMQLFVTSNAAFMEGSVTMESVNSAALTMLATHARIAPRFSLAFQFAKMCWRGIFLASIVHPVNLVYCSS